MTSELGDSSGEGQHPSPGWGQHPIVRASELHSRFNRPVEERAEIGITPGARHVGHATGQIPHAYFGWSEGNPVAYLLKFLAFGEGDTAPVTREVLRQTEQNPARRPRIHVG